ncbi:Eco57I restriction-modification methylase domain-containing protein [Gorillibacterium sp. sgz5001074]|uniref:Eco57I restriction-modification methylase domain-containing protein n=1 Tax=Gorillibacterium sp. sgz5001074 TaxID=3446695 RepID=UPI003F667D18
MNRSLYRKVSHALSRLLAREGFRSPAELATAFADVVMESGGLKAGATAAWISRWQKGGTVRLQEEVRRSALDLLEAIPHSDWRDRPELAGWLYQYMLEERKSVLYSRFKRGFKVESSDLPAVTQLFTPDWIARYMAENAIGRLALDGGETLTQPLPQWTFFDREASFGGMEGEQRPGRPAAEHWRILDPSCGCGHVLAAAFDVLLDVHLAQGMPAAQAVRTILTRNLCGLDIDPVAVRLCRFVLVLKAVRIDPTVWAEDWDLPVQVLDGENRELGSLWKNSGSGMGPGWSLLTPGYDAVLTNPPYLGRRNMGPVLAEYLDKAYPSSRNDLFAAFLERCLELLRPGGYHAAINQHVWMYLTAYETLRRHILERAELLTTLHLGPRAFQDIGGEVVQSVTVVLRKGKPRENAEGVFWKLTEEPSPQAKERAYAERRPGIRFRVRQAEFGVLPGCRIAYSIPPGWSGMYGSLPSLSRYFAVKKGMDTGDNARYVRYWHEIPAGLRGYGSPASTELSGRNGTWRPYAKGGGGRRWFGNHYYAVEWADNGRQIRQDPRSNLRNEAYYGRPGLTWSTVATGKPGFRLLEPGFLFDNGGSCLFPLTEEPDLFATLAYLNSGLAGELLLQSNPTLNIQPGDVGRLPVDLALLQDPELARMGRDCVQLAREDWDESERSWNFQEHPLLRLPEGGFPLESAYPLWVERRKRRQDRLAELEIAIDRQVYDHYRIRPSFLPRKTLRKRRTAETGILRDDLHGLLSYAVGWITGYYPPGTRQPSVKTPVVACTQSDLGRRLKEWLDGFGGPGSRSANLQWLADSLERAPEESAEERLLRYFREEWYKEHIRRSDGRPWFACIRSGREEAYVAYVPVLELGRDILHTVSRHLAEQLKASSGRPVKETQELVTFSRRLCVLLDGNLPEPDPDLCARGRLELYSFLWEEYRGEQKVDLSSYIHHQ